MLVDKQLSYSQRGNITQQCEDLSKEILNKVERLGISPSAFARYLYQQARERERAAKISPSWHVNVPGLSMDELEALHRNGLKGIRTILTNYLRLDQVRRIVNRIRVNVVPLSLVSTQEQFRCLPANSSLVLVVDDRDYPSLTLILESYRQILLDPSVKLTAMPRRRVKDLERFAKSSKFKKAIFSNRVWDDVPKRLKRHPRVTRPLMDIHLASLESARIQAGVII